MSHIYKSATSKRHRTGFAAHAIHSSWALRLSLLGLAHSPLRCDSILCLSVRRSPTYFEQRANLSRLYRMCHFQKQLHYTLHEPVPSNTRVSCSIGLLLVPGACRCQHQTHARICLGPSKCVSNSSAKCQSIYLRLPARAVQILIHFDACVFTGAFR